MFRSRSWFGSGWGRPKNPHSLEHLKYLYNVLSKNQTVSEHNRGLLVESLRCIAEILIWGDQNDSSVFDFFLEKNMLSFFLRIMRQRSGGSSFVCVQLLQTLNILFENIRNETSLYYLLSNNHVNSIIVHKFDFSDEEVMAYYISFLKTLSLKLNSHTIHFFYNEHTKDFPLYTEAIKFFNHPESMVRIAVRTLTLNVYRVQDASMLKFIRDRTAAPYFSNLVWFIGKHILELDTCVRNDAELFYSSHQSQQKLDDLVAEHLDHLHYINDILCLNIPDLNDVLTEHLLHKLLIPLYIYSLTSSSSYLQSNVNVQTRDQVQSIESITRNLAAILKHVEMAPEKRPNYPHTSRDSSEEDYKPSVSCVVSLFLLSQVFLIITHGPIVHALAWIILQSDNSVFEEGATKILEMYLSNKKSCVKLEFSKPSETLEKALESSCLPVTPGTVAAAVEFGRFCDDSYEKDVDQYSCDMDPDVVCNSLPSTSHVSEASSTRHNSSDDLSLVTSRPYDVAEELSSNIPDSPLPDCEKPESASNLNSNITDEEKQKIYGSASSNEQLLTLDARLQSEALEVDNKPFLKTVLDSMDCIDNDYKALFSLCLLFALINNKGVNTELLDILLCPVVLHPSEQSDPSTGGPDAEQEDPQRSQPGIHCSFNVLLVDKLLAILHLSCKPTSKVRLVTLELSVRLLRIALEGNRAQRPHPRHLHQVELLRNKATALLKNFYKCDDLFLDMFEDEYCEMCKRPLNVEWLCMDAAILLPPTRTPMSGIAFAKRLPSGEMERARRAIRSYFLIRDLYLKLTGKLETLLPLANPNPFVQVGDILDLNDSDLISCNITKKDGTWHHQFLAIDHIQIILVEPDKHRLGWGVAKLVGSLQDLEIQGDKEDPRCLHVTIHKPLSTSSSGGLPRTPLLSAKFKFDDHIRSMATKQRLTKGRTKSRQKKMQQIARLLEIPGMTGSVPNSYKSNPSASSRQHRPLFTAGARHPGFAALRRESAGSADTPEGPERRIRNPSVHLLKDGMMVVYGGRSSSRDGYNLETSETWNKVWLEKIKQTLDDAYDGSHLNRSSSRNSSATRSRESSPRPRSEEIPLEDIRGGPGAPAHSSHQTPAATFAGIQRSPATGATSKLVQARPQRASSISEEVTTPRSQSQDNQKETSKNGKLTTQRSEETSFIADDGSKAKKKGRIEII